MQLLTSRQHISISERQQEYLEKKMSNLEKFAARVSDASSRCHVDIRKKKVKDKEQKIELAAKLSLPQDNFHTDVHGMVFEEAVDLLFDKLCRHIKKYKEQK